MKKDKRQADAEAKGDLDHRIIVAGPEARARESKGDDKRPVKTAVKRDHTSDRDARR